VIQPFTKIVVDKKEEAKFRRRALNCYPYEHIEALWGYVRGDVLYICAFMAMEHKVTIKTIHYSDHELDDHEDDAREAGLEFLGTIHTHPDCADNRFGDTDLEMSQESQECVMGILAIETKTKDETTKKVKKLRRRRTHIAYWPTVRPLTVVRKDWDAQSAASTKRPRKAGKIKGASKGRRKARR
jgi:proteasome lid subunit RPN8/RPN11